MSEHDTAATRRQPPEIHIGEFMRLLAHELGNPVATIRMSSEMLLGELPSEVQTQLSQIILDEAIRLEQLIESAIYYTAIGRGSVLGLDLRQFLEALSHQNDQSSTDGASATPITTRNDSSRSLIGGDAGQLSRLFRELIANAAQSGASSIEIAAADDGDRLRIDVVDDGEGIPSDRFETVFKPFYTTREGRLGLGLSIARRIAELHGGSITVAPGKSSGSVVSVLLPTSTSISA